MSVFVCVYCMQCVIQIFIMTLALGHLDAPNVYLQLPSSVK